MAIIDAPQLPPLIFKRNGKQTYVCTYKNQWSPELKASIRLKGAGKTVGKIANGALEGIIEWSDEFLQQYPVLTQLQTARIKDERRSSAKRTAYLLKFSPAPAKTKAKAVTSTVPGERSELQQFKAGATYMLDKLIASTPVAQALEQCFPAKLRAQLLSLAYFKVLEPTSALSLYEFFARETRLPCPLPLELSAIERLLSSIKVSHIENFVATLNHYSSLLDLESSEDKARYYALDTTIVSPYSRFMNEAHAQLGARTIKVLWLVNARTSCPAYYRTYTGTSPDMTQFMAALPDSTTPKVERKTILVAEPRYGSVEHLQQLCCQGQSFVLDMSKCKDFSYPYLQEHLERLQGIGKYEPRLKLNVLTLKASAGAKVDELYIHLYLDPELRAQAEADLRERFAHIKEILREQTPKQLSSEQRSFYQRYMYHNPENGSLSEQPEQIDDYLLSQGTCVLVSDCIADPLEAYRAYQTRQELALSLNQAYAEHLGAKSQEGKLLVLFLAGSIESVLRAKIKASYAHPRPVPYDSPAKILRTLSGIKQTVINNISYFSKIDEPSEHIFAALGIPVPA